MVENMYKKQYLNWLVVILLASCFISNSLAAQDVEYSKTPKWVTTHEIPNIGISKLPADYLLYDKQVRVKKNNQSTYTRLVYRLNNNRGVEQLSDIFLGFDPAYQTLTIHTVDLIRDGQLVNRLEPDDITVSEESADYLMHTGRMQAKLLLKDIRKGDTIDYSYSLTGKNPVFGDQYDSGMSLQWSVPLGGYYLSVMMEKGRELFYKIHHTKDVVVNQRSDKNWSYYEIQLGAQKAIEEQTEVPVWFSAYPFIEFSEYKDWEDVTQWAIDLFDVNLDNDEPLQTYIESLQSMEKRKAIDHAIQFVQEDIRYLGLELGENSHRPHLPDEVFNNRYGDCKDKTLLLQILLRSIGVESYPALVSTYQQNELFKALPSPGVFNHVILWIDIDNGYWVDATKTLQGKRINSLYQPNYGAALLIKEGNTKLISAKPNEQINKITVQENIYAGDYISPVEMEIITTYKGGAAETFRSTLEQNTLNQIADNFLDFYRRIYPDIELVNKIKVKDDMHNNTVVLREQYMVPDYWVDEDGASAFSLYNQLVGEYLVNPEQIKRVQPLGQSHPVMIDYQSNLYISEWIDFQWPEAPLIVENDYFKVTTVYQNDLRKLSLNSVYQSKKNYVDTSDARDHINDMALAKNNIIANPFVTNVAISEDYKSVKKLLNELNSNREFQE